jgi:hypothetical protein
MEENKEPEEDKTGHEREDIEQAKDEIIDPAEEIKKKMAEAARTIQDPWS